MGELRRLISKADQDTSGTLSQEEFMEFMKDQRFRRFFELRGLDVKDVAVFFKLLTSMSGSDEVEIGSFVSGCMAMRGMASAMDLHALSFQVHVLHTGHKEFTKRWAREASDIRFALDSLRTDRLFPFEKKPPAGSPGKVNWGIADGGSTPSWSTVRNCEVLM